MRCEMGFLMVSVCELYLELVSEPGTISERVELSLACPQREGGPSSPFTVKVTDSIESSELACFTLVKRSPAILVKASPLINFDS